ncbi:hypothetical protein CPT_Sonora_071 [Stenotrophomonas phage Sonora]|nr:hypothetical protein CPT_Sonora_071 [Stenotrophomonas phage Sonora]
MNVPVKRKVVISGHPNFHFDLDAKTVNALVKSANTHYDGVCRLSVEVGGFLRGWVNRLEYGNGEAVDVVATWRELDLACKIAENASFLNDPEHSRLLREFLRLVHEMFAVSRSQNWTVEVLL